MGKGGRDREGRGRKSWGERTEEKGWGGGGRRSGWRADGEKEENGEKALVGRRAGQEGG